MTNRCKRVTLKLPISSESPSAFLRYTLTGGLATGAHFAFLLAFVELFGAPPGPSATLGAAIGAIVAYIGNHRYAFASHGTHQHALPRFLLVAALGIAANGLLVWAGSMVLGWHYLGAQALATMLCLGLTFHLNRFWTFV